MTRDRYVLKILGYPILGLGDSPHDGKWLAFYDPTAHDGRGEIRSTDDLGKARIFTSPQEAFACYRQQYGLRQDGKPNRPLMAYAIEVAAIIDLEKGITQ